MGEITDKLKGAANDAIGNVKQGVGKAIDKPDLQAEGMAQEAKGEMQKAKGTVKGKIDKI